MKNKENFKKFVNSNPSFADAVKNGKTSWQKLYELYMLYDEDSKVFDEYKKEAKTSLLSNSSLSLSGIVNSLKGINLDNFQNNIASIQKAVGFLEEFTKKDPKRAETKAKARDEAIDRFYSD